MTLFPCIFLFFLAQPKCNPIYHFSSQLDQYTIFFQQDKSSNLSWANITGWTANGQHRGRASSKMGWTACASAGAAPHQKLKKKTADAWQTTRTRDLLNHRLQPYH